MPEGGKSICETNGGGDEEIIWPRAWSSLNGRRLMDNKKGNGSARWRLDGNIEMFCLRKAGFQKGKILEIKDSEKLGSRKTRI